VIFLLKNACILLKYIPVEYRDEEICEIATSMNFEEYLYVPDHLITEKMRKMYTSGGNDDIDYNPEIFWNGVPNWLKS
jgi:hypothetical protein